MDSLMSGVLMVEAALLSVLLGLWMTWLGLRGLFVLMPIRTRSGRSAEIAAERKLRGPQAA